MAVLLIKFVIGCVEVGISCHYNLFEVHVIYILFLVVVEEPQVMLFRLCCTFLCDSVTNARRLNKVNLA